jgi:hypothetical protein
VHFDALFCSARENQQNCGQEIDVQSPSVSQANETAILTRAVENVFRRLIRFLVGRISLVRLQEIIRHIYVEEAENSLRKESPGKNVPMTRLALVTGLDTRTLVRVRQKIKEGRQQYRQLFVTELTPESAIVEAWADLVEQSDQPEEKRLLAYGESDSAFETLVRSTISTRGITTQSIIQRLVDTNSIEQDKENRVLKLIVDHYSPYLSGDQPNIINAAFLAIANLISTIEHNVSTAQENRLFQRQVWTFRLSEDDQPRFRDAMRDLLTQYENTARKAISPWEKESYGKEMKTAGVGLYYFEDR